MLTETQEIADLFRNPRKVHRTLPFKKFASHTYGKGKLTQPGSPSPDPEPSPDPDPDPPGNR
jgi:hypothetical protein